MNMTSFCLLTLIIITVLHCGHCDEPKTISGCEGETAVIKCPLQSKDRLASKSLVRSVIGDAQEVIRSDGRVKWAHKGRVSLQDQKKKNRFIVTIHNLRVDDAGTYQCVAGGCMSKQVKLSMARDSPHCSLIKVTGYEGGKAAINCPFWGDYRFASKLLVNRSFGGVQEVIRSDGRAQWTHRGRVSLQDKKDRGIFTVTIRNLAREDAGKYQCIAEGRVSEYVRQVELTVAHSPPRH
ncbi:polymeric immunoglobulin receptor-like [Alosa sapidissima]|uniref:polymeric immunoglobulin receptor-like n=1 Tax=Alosa sapidissima TaxID=34773 RepID=UPI001C0913D3|nr:polymeric immunoglobulin receptor-like [Alosa sapidissima]